LVWFKERASARFFMVNRFPDSAYQLLSQNQLAE
jgi:hypothetical protein